MKVESMPSIGNSAVSEILQVNSLLSENDGKEDRLEGIDQDNLLSEEARLCERANALWQEFSAPITENVRQQFDAMMLEFHIERALTLMSLGIDPMLVVKPLLSGRDDSVLLKSILVGSIMSRFCGKDNSNNWGPILVVCKMRDMERWEAGLSQSLAKAQLEILSYYGSDSDRISLRSYLRSLSSLGGLNSIGTGLYADRSHCHVLLMCYETLLLDMHYFKDICWFSCVFDEPWGLFSDQQYAFPSKQVTALLQARHKLFTCSNLGKRVVEQDSCELLLPDLGVVLANVFPYFSGQQKLDESTSSIVSHFDPQKPFSIHFFGGCEYIELDESSKTNLLRLLISATSVWDPAIFDRLNVGELISHDSQNVQDICGLLSIAEWNGWSLESRNLQMRPDSLIQVMVRDASTGHVSFDSQFQRESNVTYTNSFFDVEMRMELRQINLSVVGKSGPHIMRMKPLHEESSSTDRNQRHEMSLRPTGRGRGRGNLFSMHYL